MRCDDCFLVVHWYYGHFSLSGCSGDWALLGDCSFDPWMQKKSSFSDIIIKNSYYSAPRHHPISYWWRHSFHLRLEMVLLCFYAHQTWEMMLCVPLKHELMHHKIFNCYQMSHAHMTWAPNRLTLQSSSNPSVLSVFYSHSMDSISKFISLGVANPTREDSQQILVTFIIESSFAMVCGF